MSILDLYTLLVLLYWTTLTFYLLINGRKIKYLSSIQITENKSPSVVIIIAVRNEEADLKNALISVCNLDYSNFKITVVNDRSTDNTAAILKELQKQYPINVLNVDTLPEGWLGKNHALYKGYISSDEEYMLFTDADVVFKKDALSKAMHFATTNDLDHLTILPEIISPSSRSEEHTSELQSR